MAKSHGHNRTTWILPDFTDLPAAILDTSRQRHIVFMMLNLYNYDHY